MARTYNNMGYVELGSGDYDAALKCYSKAIITLQITQGIDTVHPEIAQYHRNVAGVYMNMNNHAKALAHLNQSLAMRRQIYGADSNHPDIQTCINDLKKLRQAIFFS